MADEQQKTAAVVDGERPLTDKELEAEIIAQGGEVVNNISKNTTHLIVADLASSSGKAVKARSWNIPLFTIEGFKSL